MENVVTRRDQVSSISPCVLSNCMQQWEKNIFTNSITGRKLNFFAFKRVVVTGYTCHMYRRIAQNIMFNHNQIHFHRLQIMRVHACTINASYDMDHSNACVCMCVCVWLVSKVFNVHWPYGTRARALSSCLTYTHTRAHTTFVKCY